MSDYLQKHKLTRHSLCNIMEIYTHTHDTFTHT